MPARPERVERTVSSYNLVSSRHRTALRSPQAAASSAEVSATLRGLSYTISVPLCRARRATASRRSLPVRGKKPTKQASFAGSPLRTSAVRDAEGPGSTSKGSPLCMKAATSRSPGSDMPGSPASDTKAIASPSATRPAISSALPSSLCSWQDMRGLDIPSLDSMAPVLRVSSQYILWHSLSTLRARSVMSSMFPMGVGQR